ncbi:MAG: serine/threonine-protein kinase [Thermoanaerobaculia bacterium]
MTEPESPPARVDRYQILAELGRGSMGRVYLAHDPNTDRRVALKLISASGSGTEAEELEARSRFLLEARAAGRLQHPGIVLLYDADADGATGRPFLAMEWVEGRSLAALLRERGALPWREAARLAVEVARALDHAHSRGVVHRDVKPGNVLVTEDGRVKVSDFGIAKFVSESHTVAGMVLGTPHYMSPEQVRGEAIDGRSDLFALGAVLYEMVTGEPPFRGESLTTISYKVVFVDPRPPSIAAGDLPPELERIVLKALEKDPAARFANGAEMAAALEAAIAAAPPDPTPAPLPAPARPPGMPPPPQRAAPPPPPPARPMPPPSALRAGAGTTPPPWPAHPQDLGEASGATTASRRDLELGRRLALGVAVALVVGIAGWLAWTRWAAPGSPAGSAPIPSTPSSPPPNRPAVPPAAPGGPATSPVTPPARQPAVFPSPSASPPPTPARAPAPIPSSSAPGAEAPAAVPVEVPVGSPLSATLGTLEIVYFNRLGHGTMTVWIDETRVWSSSLEAPRDLLQKVQGEKVRFALAVAPGSHLVEVRVSQPSAYIDSRGTVRAEFRPGELRSLRVKLVPYIPRLALDWPNEDED